MCRLLETPRPHQRKVSLGSDGPWCLWRNRARGRGKEREGVRDKLLASDGRLLLQPCLPEECSPHCLGGLRLVI